MNMIHLNGTDRWLTPPDLVEALGPFDLDPCCEPWMPWRTAARMVSLPPERMLIKQDDGSLVPYARPEPAPGITQVAADVLGDGLDVDWSGRKFLNHPYGAGGLPWINKMALNPDGVALTSAKSTDSAWGQLALRTSDAALFLEGRILFHYPDGRRSTGKWLSNVLWAWGGRNVDALRRLEGTGYRGVLMGRLK